LSGVINFRRKEGRFIECGIGKGMDKVVLFETFGFVRSDSVKDDEVVAILHTREGIIIELKFDLSTLYFLTILSNI